MILSLQASAIEQLSLRTEILFNFQKLLYIHRYAIRDIRRSYQKLWVIALTLFISLLLLSLTFSVKQSLNDEIQANSKELLGGDIRIDSGIYPLSEAQLTQLSSVGQVSETVSFFTMTLCRFFHSIRRC